MTLLVLAAAISITVSRAVCLAPCDVVVTLRTEPAKNNQKVVLVMESDSYYRSSEMDANEWTPKTVQIVYKALPSGEYVIKVTLWKHDGATWIAGTDSKTINVHRFEP